LIIYNVYYNNNYELFEFKFAEKRTEVLDILKAVMKEEVAENSDNTTMKEFIFTVIEQQTMMAITAKQNRDEVGKMSG